MIERLTPHKKLVAEGIAPSFLTDLRTATKQLADAIKAGERLGAQVPAAYLELKPRSRAVAPRSALRMAS